MDFEISRDNAGTATDTPVLDTSPSGAGNRSLQRRRRHQTTSSFRLDPPIDFESGKFERSSSKRIASQSAKDSIRHPENHEKLVDGKRVSSRRHQHASHSQTVPGGLEREDESGHRSPSNRHGLSQQRSSLPPSSRHSTDPAQILKLALSLSQSRKRSSSTRISSGRSHLSRNSSSALPLPGPLVPSLQVAGDLSLSPRLANESDVTPPGPTTIDLRYGAADYGPVNFSDATFARAEKAKQHFELFASHLRLLAHLPPLRPRDLSQMRHYGSRGGQADDGIGRAYNPLQYIRNRKVRFRERQAFDSEAKGWGDVAAVAHWVDQVIESNLGKFFQPNDVVPLLPLNNPGIQEDYLNERNPALEPIRSNASDASRPRRPRMDWVISPPDLLADVAWVETGFNKAKIEDSDGNKLFPLLGKAKSKPDTKSDQHQPGLESIGEKVGSQLNKRGSSDSISAFPSPGRSPYHSPERERRKHRFAHSINLDSSHSRSRRNSKTGRASRSKLGSSSSSSSTSSDGNGHWRRRFPKFNKAKPTPVHDINEGLSLKPGSDTKQLDSDRGSRLSPLNTEFTTQEAPSIGYPASISSAVSDGGNRREKSPLDTPIHNNSLFPSMNINLSPPRERSKSPTGRLPISLPHLKYHRHKHGNKSETAERISEHLDEQGNISDYPTAPNSPLSGPFIPMDQFRRPALRRAESSPTRISRMGQHQESRIRGMFKGGKGGRIAELVGNEVSKVGDIIRKKDTADVSRASSISSLASEYLDAAADRVEKKPVSKGHLDTPPDDPNRFGLNMEKNPLKSRSTSVPAFTRTLYQRDSIKDLKQGQLDTSVGQRKTPDAISLPARPKLADTTRVWSMSSSSITRYTNSHRINKREVTRVRAYLMSSGIKALEICRSSRMPSGCVETWLKSTNQSNINAPYIATSFQTKLAAEKSILSLDDRVAGLKRSMTAFNVSGVSPLKSDLQRLEELVSSSLTTRIRTVTTQAEDLTMELSTTSTLAIKQLHDALDKGIRKRNRRLRWVIRFGYVLLEWVLVGVLWWVWTVVMVFRIFRGLWRGTVSGIRWIFWL
ncbi:hypothetical protein FQN57_003497 [Myotisia sp. PD_48]|nr:hypothetical protein FQN57_003497 [Myotisia sp. PD_48]